jgi:hypothetical protein
MTYIGGFVQPSMIAHMDMYQSWPQKLILNLMNMVLDTVSTLVGLQSHPVSFNAETFLSAPFEMPLPLALLLSQIVLLSSPPTFLVTK